MSETPRIEQPETSSPDSGDMGFSEVMDQMTERKERYEEFLRSLEGQPFEQETFAVEDLKKMIEIKKKLNEIIERSKSGENQLDCLDEVIDYLDDLDCWLMKFSTGDVGKPSEVDSLYYVMSNGVSLRIKRANFIKKGLNAVVQPFMERIFFEDEQGNPTEHIRPGVTTMEYCSREFYELQNQTNVEKDFKSTIKAFYKDGKLFYVSPPKNLFAKHNGNEVNDFLYFSPESQK